MKEPHVVGDAVESDMPMRKGSITQASAGGKSPRPGSEQDSRHESFLTRSVMADSEATLVATCRMGN